MPKKHCSDRLCKGNCQHCYHINEDLQKSRRRSNRSFDPDNGTVNGRSAYVEQSGDRTVGYSGPDKVGKIVTNDGENASYVRGDDGKVIVNDANDDPYEPYDWKSH